MSITLYRKYRPQQFKDVVGQNHINIILENEIILNKLAHAYLFSGPRGTGKTTMARIFAKSLNCQNRKNNSAEPCGICNSCKEIENGHSIDVIEIDAASHTGVDNVRENIIENSRFAPTYSPYKIFIIDEAHMLSIAAFNALLKTLEEPPSYVVFILATTEIHKMPATIVSRCQRFDFKKIPADILINRLKQLAAKENIKVSKDVLNVIAQHSDGCLRDAESLLGQVLTLSNGKKEITLDEASLVLPHTDIILVGDFVELLLKKDGRAALEFISKIVGEGLEVNEFFNDLIKFFRALIWYKIANDLKFVSFVFDEGKRMNLLNLVNNKKTEELMNILEILLEKKALIGQTQIAELPLELAAIKICAL